MIKGSDPTKLEFFIKQLFGWFEFGIVLDLSQPPIECFMGYVGQPFDESMLSRLI
ncbi:hypothetical protein GCM10028778_21330 [Barrientosiimonas marina]